MGASAAHLEQEPTKLSVYVPIRTKSEANRSRHEHWSTTRARVSAQHEAVTLHLRSRAVACPWPPPVVVRLVRFSAGELDDDNLRSALKAVRDAVAKWLKVDDKRVELARYEYDQARCGKGQGGVRIEVFPLVAPRRLPPPPVSPVSGSKGLGGTPHR